MDPNSGNTGNLPQPASTPQAAPAPQAPAQQAPSAAVPPSAKDSDRIEREWIVKTRQILVATATDPYEQAKQIAALRADYMAKRYNKIIKAGE